MPSYTPPLKDIDFLLHDVMKITESDIPGYDELDRDFTTAILDEAGKIARDVLFPLNEVGDRQGCKLENGVVRTPEGFGDAWKALSEGGWTGLDCDPEYGGQGLPHLMNTATGELFSSANMAFQIYTGLTHGAANALYAHGTDEQKRTYLPPMYEGRWTGTMNLTEPQCGTDLGLIRTKAEPQDDGSYSITGNKIWISGGEHDMAENIVHLVLAKIPGGPEGVKGISLFVVPKFLVKEDGSLGERNNLKCTALEEKMGIHGNATCYMSYEGAKGWLVGEEHKGLRAMFVMMNEARLSVGLEGYAQGEISYQNALAFARERVQGRDVTGTQNPDGPADPIIVHPDVRRNLLDQKSLTEGGRAFVYWAAELIDRSHRMDDQEAENLVSLLTPVVKGFLTDKGFESSVMAQQTLGGSGFTRDFGIEQYVRDARIAMIYEGTNGVQSLDLVGRKLGLNGGKPIMGFFEMVKGFIKENEGNEKLKSDFLEPLKAASKDLQAAGMYFMQEGAKNPLNALSGSYDFMHLFGHVCLGLMWGQMAKAAMEKMDEDGADTAFLTSKIETGRYYMARQLPATKMHLARIQSGADTVMTLDAAGF